MRPMTLPDPFLPQLYKVGKSVSELPDVVTLELAPVSGQRPAFTAGQFNMLYVFGVGEVAISMSGDPAETDKIVHTIRDVGKVSGALTKLEPGAVVGVRGPYGTGWPVEAAEGSDIVIVAAGLGLAPVRPAIYQILANRERYGRISILAGFHSPQDVYFAEDLAHWRQRLDVDVQITVNHARPGWHGNVGQPVALIPRLGFDPHETFAMICGSEAKMRYMSNVLHDMGVKESRIYLAMERNMKCAIGLCGRCQFGPDFICKNGPVMQYDKVARILAVREI